MQRIGRQTIMATSKKSADAPILRSFKVKEAATPPRLSRVNWLAVVLPNSTLTLTPLGVAA
ncbi:MAG: hypothetical protein IPK53_07720 [bacterium]|nr:hypothetical protein [bacterium]